MRLSESEIIEAMLEHIRQGGGDFTEWCVGTAKQGLGARDWGLGNEKSGLGARDLGLGGGRQQTVDGRQGEQPDAVHGTLETAPPETSNDPGRPTVAETATVDTNSTHLIYREAYTKYAAAEIAERLADFGIRLDHRSVPTPGDIVFVYRARAAVPAGRVARAA